MFLSPKCKDHNSFGTNLLDIFKSSTSKKFSEFHCKSWRHFILFYCFLQIESHSIFNYQIVFCFLHWEFKNICLCINIVNIGHSNICKIGYLVPMSFCFNSVTSAIISKAVSLILFFIIIIKLLKKFRYWFHFLSLLLVGLQQNWSFWIARNVYHIYTSKFQLWTITQTHIQSKTKLYFID